MSARMEGLAELDDALKQLPAALRRAVVLAALRKASRPIVRAAQASAPRGKDPKKRGSKRQRETGQSEAMGPGWKSIKPRAAKSDSATSATLAVGPDADHFYMRFSELGTSREEAQRWLTLAFEAHKEEAAQLVGEELWKVLSATAEKLAARAASGRLNSREQRALTS